MLDTENIHLSAARIATCVAMGPSKSRSFFANHGRVGCRCYGKW